MLPKTPAGRLIVVNEIERYKHDVLAIASLLHSTAVGMLDPEDKESEYADWLRMRIDTWEPSVNAFDCAVYLAATAALGEWSAFATLSDKYDQSQDT
jgi:hypothetical protein